MLLQGETSNVQKVIEILLTIEDYREDVMNAAQQLKQQGLEQGLQQGREEGLEEGDHRRAVAIAKNLLNMGADKDFIKKATGLSEQDLITIED